MFRLVHTVLQFLYSKWLAFSSVSPHVLVYVRHFTGYLTLLYFNLQIIPCKDFFESFSVGFSNSYEMFPFLALCVSQKLGKRLIDESTVLLLTSIHDRFEACYFTIFFCRKLEHALRFFT